MNEQDEYLQFHYATGEEYAPLVQPFISKEALEFPALCAKECSISASGHLRALDIGCAVGGSTFELARSFGEVVGFDFSAAFIKAANELQESGSKSYVSTVEGVIKENRIAKVNAHLILSYHDLSAWMVLFSRCPNPSIDPSASFSLVMRATCPP